MNRFPIKERVVIWFSIMLMTVICMVVSFYIVAITRSVNDDVKQNLRRAVDDAVEDIKIVGGNLMIDSDLNYKTGGIRVALFSGTHKDISGMLPEAFDDSTAFSDETVRQVKCGKKRYYVCDRLIENERTGDIWVRGVVSASLKDNAGELQTLINVMLLTLPFIILAVILIGWFMIKKAFRPLVKIADTASEISTGNDLSKRIGAGSPDSQDEVMRTAGAFDRMMDRVEESFNNEKQFTNNASHELRTPTAVIKAQTEYALDNLDDPAEVGNSLRVIDTHADKMRDIVSHLLILARADSGKQKLNREKTDVSLLAEEAAFTAKGVAVSKGVTVDVDAEAGIYLDCDRTFFARAYDNLIGNAVKYCENGGNVRVSVSQDRDHVTICVSDDGPGIPEKDLPHVFERFYRSGSVSSKEGTGLGLPLVKWIVEAHGGKIVIESKEGRGTNVIMRFPSMDL